MKRKVTESQIEYTLYDGDKILCSPNNIWGKILNTERFFLVKRKWQKDPPFLLNFYFQPTLQTSVTAIKIEFIKKGKVWAVFNKVFPSLFMESHDRFQVTLSFEMRWNGR